VFWAGRDDALVRVAISDGRSGLTVNAFPVEPGGLVAGAIVGFVARFLMAWIGMTWLTRRLDRRPRPVRRWILLAGVPVLIACVVNGLGSVLSMAPDPASADAFFPADLMYPLALQLADPVASLVVALSALAVAVLLGRSRRAQVAEPEAA
jgi:hypothetical protein